MEQVNVESILLLNKKQCKLSVSSRMKYTTFLVAS